jgi:hypothetical protein
LLEMTIVMRLHIAMLPRQIVIILLIEMIH